MPGRVVRLQFECCARLPIGSFLRVTGSSLWAPGTAASDPAEAAPAVGRTEAGAFPVTEDHTTLMTSSIGGGGSQTSAAAASFSATSHLYTSSVEMVTTPEKYPIWQTRHPVVVVVNRHAALKQRVQHHYYRYLVVSPGATPTSDSEDTAVVSVSTSSEFMGSTVVMQWEDPMDSLDNTNEHLHDGSGKQRGGRGGTTSTSTVSLASSVNLPATAHTRSDYRNLPYRTLDIDVSTDRFVVVHDNWDVADDATFQPYLIREAVRRAQSQPPTFGCLRICFFRRVR